MKIETLIKEAESLARPIVYLVPHGAGSSVGTWYGPTAGERQNDARCWLALDCAALPLLEIPSGILAVYFDERSLKGFAILPAALDVVYEDCGDLVFVCAG
ncbi:MAG TPA: hypothetical protein VFH31_00095 [Pyrinomonadaceae bacterium]|nr:hypothetical protein [Pyrinomonadaceae bacterium]